MEVSRGHGQTCTRELHCIKISVYPTLNTYKLTGDFLTTIAGIAQRLLQENGFVADASSINITAQNILDENKWTVANIALANLETLMDNAINYINLEANTSIAPMSGTSESQICTLTRSESLAFKSLTSLMVRAYLDKGPNIGVSSLSVSNVINDPHYTLFSDIIQKSINRLKTANPVYVEYLITNAISIVNLHAGTSITALSGTAGNKSLTATDNEIIVVKLVASQFLQNHLNGKLGSFKLTTAVTDSIKILKGRSFERT